MLDALNKKVKKKNASKPRRKYLIIAFSGVRILPSFSKGEFVSNACQDQKER